uniref:Uncharacterized protein n=1 Tax=Timema cristinae TaxID=61476 RepID=A0A7R9D5F9_TIMCR|nr:unnamed protein product [Timema cristinae]
MYAKIDYLSICDGRRTIDIDRDSGWIKLSDLGALCRVVHPVVVINLWIIPGHLAWLAHYAIFKYRCSPVLWDSTCGSLLPILHSPHIISGLNFWVVPAYLAWTTYYMLFKFCCSPVCCIQLLGGSYSSGGAHILIDFLGRVWFRLWKFPSTFNSSQCHRFPLWKYHSTFNSSQCHSFPLWKFHSTFNSSQCHRFPLLKFPSTFNISQCHRFPLWKFHSTFNSSQCHRFPLWKFPSTFNSSQCHRFPHQSTAYLPAFVCSSPPSFPLSVNLLEEVTARNTKEGLVGTDNSKCASERRRVEEWRKDRGRLRHSTKQTLPPAHFIVLVLMIRENLAYINHRLDSSIVNWEEVAILAEHRGRIVSVARLVNAIYSVQILASANDTAMKVHVIIRRTNDAILKNKLLANPMRERLQLISTLSTLALMFGTGEPIKSQNQPSKISVHVHLTTHALYRQKLADSFIGHCEEI